jgi:hypothetical protein
MMGIGNFDGDESRVRNVKEEAKVILPFPNPSDGLPHPVAAYIAKPGAVSMLVKVTDAMRRVSGRAYSVKSIVNEMIDAKSVTDDEKEQCESLLTTLSSDLINMDKLVFPSSETFPSTKWSGAVIEIGKWTARVMDSSDSPPLLLSTIMFVEFTNGDTLSLRFKHLMKCSDQLGILVPDYSELSMVWKNELNRGDELDANNQQVFDIFYSWIGTQMLSAIGNPHFKKG